MAKPRRAVQMLPSNHFDQSTFSRLKRCLACLLPLSLTLHSRHCPVFLLQLLTRHPSNLTDSHVTRMNSCDAISAHAGCSTTEAPSAVSTGFDCEKRWWCVQGRVQQEHCGYIHGCIRDHSRPQYPHTIPAIVENVASALSA